MAAALSNVYQFKITLRGIKPSIWRRIQVPSNYNFYELHVAIADAMGWADFTLHKFIMEKPTTGKKVHIFKPTPHSFGVGPLDEWIDAERLKIAQYFVAENVEALYVFDLDDDNWEHDVVLEKILPAAENVEYPRCLAGERAGVPIFCRGVHGYEELLQNLKLEFGHENYDPEEFDPNSVQFDDPKERKRRHELIHNQ